MTKFAKRGLAGRLTMLWAMVGLLTSPAHAQLSEDLTDEQRMVLNPPTAYPPLGPPPAAPQQMPRQQSASPPQRMILAQARPNRAPEPQRASPPGMKPAQAAAPAGAPSGVAAWSAQCRQPGAKETCELIRRLVREDGQQVVAVVVNHVPGRPGQIIATVVLPLGINVRESIPMLIDDRFIALLPVETCLPVGCITTVLMSPPMAQAWAQGRTLQFLTLSAQGQTVPLAVPLVGFAAEWPNVAG